MSPVPAADQGPTSASRQSAEPTEPTRKGEGARSGERLLAVIARDRDREAFREIFDAYGPRIKWYVCARGAAEALADEVVQDVMLKVWRRAHLYDPAKAGANTWIHAIARHCLLSRLRREGRPEIEDDDPNRVPPTPPDEDFSLAEGRSALTSAMKELPKGEVDVVHASYFEGLSMSEIAERHGVPLGTVKSRMRCALARLRALLQRTAQ